jgi:hypothetical protein
MGEGWSGLPGNGPDYPRIRTTEGKFRSIGTIRLSLSAKLNLPEAEMLHLRVCNNSNYYYYYYCNNYCNGKYWFIVGPKLSGPFGDPDYRCPDYRTTAVLNTVDTRNSGV